MLRLLTDLAAVAAVIGALYFAAIPSLANALAFAFAAFCFVYDPHQHKGEKK